MHLDVCLIIEMCASRFGLGFTHDALYIFARHMFMHISCILILSFSLFLVVMSLSLSDRLRMAPKRKSTLARNSLGFGSSSSDPLVPPLHVWFCDGKAQQDFLENFQKHGIHLEHHVVLSDFSDIPFPTIIRTQG